MPKEIAICIGNKSTIDKEKLSTLFEEHEIDYAITFYTAPENKQGPVSLAAFLTQQSRDAAMWMIIQGTTLDDSKGERAAEEVQMFVDGASLPFIAYLFWDGPIAPEEILARQLFQMLTREIPIRH